MTSLAVGEGINSGSRITFRNFDSVFFFFKFSPLLSSLSASGCNNVEIDCSRGSFLLIMSHEWTSLLMQGWESLTVASLRWNLPAVYDLIQLSVSQVL